METYKKYINEGYKDSADFDLFSDDPVKSTTAKGDTLDSRGTKKVLFLKNGSISIKSGKSQIMLHKQEASALLRSLKNGLKG